MCLSKEKESNDLKYSTKNMNMLISNIKSVFLMRKLEALPEKSGFKFVFTFLNFLILSFVRSVFFIAYQFYYYIFKETFPFKFTDGLYIMFFLSFFGFLIILLLNRLFVKISFYDNLYISSLYILPSYAYCIGMLLFIISLKICNIILTVNFLIYMGMIIYTYFFYNINIIKIWVSDNLSIYQYVIYTCIIFFNSLYLIIPPVKQIFVNSSSGSYSWFRQEN